MRAIEGNVVYKISGSELENNFMHQFPGETIREFNKINQFVENAKGVYVYDGDPPDGNGLFKLFPLWIIGHTNTPIYFIRKVDTTPPNNLANLHEERIPAWLTAARISTMPDHMHVVVTNKHSKDLTIPHSDFIIAFHPKLEPQNITFHENESYKVKRNHGVLELVTKKQTGNVFKRKIVNGGIETKGENFYMSPRLPSQVRTAKIESTWLTEHGQPSGGPAKIEYSGYEYDYYMFKNQFKYGQWGNIEGGCAPELVDYLRNNDRSISEIRQYLPLDHKSIFERAMTYLKRQRNTTGELNATAAVVLQKMQMFVNDEIESRKKFAQDYENWWVGLRTQVEYVSAPLPEQRDGRR